MGKISKYFLRRKKQKAKKDPKKYQNCIEEEKEKKCQYHSEPNKNISEEQKQKLAECTKNYYIAHDK